MLNLRRDGFIRWFKTFKAELGPCKGKSREARDCGLRVSGRGAQGWSTGSCLRRGPLRTHSELFTFPPVLLKEH